jgi:hypothetical protein
MPVAPSPHPEPRRAVAVEEPRLDDATTDDADMVVIEDDVDGSGLSRAAVFAVRPGDYRSLFTRLRRGTLS